MGLISIGSVAGGGGGGSSVTLKTYSTTAGTIAGAISSTNGTDGNGTFTTATAIDPLAHTLFSSGVAQVYGVTGDYTISGVTITFNAGKKPIAGANAWIMIHGQEA